MPDASPGGWQHEHHIDLTRRALAISKNKMCAGLTVLGIVIGVAAVIVLVSISQSAGLMIHDQFQSLGTDVLFVIPGSQEGGGIHLPSGSIVTLVAADADAMSAECPAVLATSPMVSSRAQLVAGNQNWSPDQIYGVNEKYLTIGNWRIKKGDYFTPNDVHAAAKVCVIGKTVVDNLFGGADCIGTTIRIKNIPFQVIGILEPKGANLFGQDQDNIVLAPFTTIKKRVSGSTYNNIDAVFVCVRATNRMQEADDEVTQLLRQRHRSAIPCEEPCARSRRRNCRAPDRNSIARHGWAVPTVREVRCIH